MESGRKQTRHFVLVHGLGHGAWCWYKVATILRSAGHRVTALDLPSCGASPVRVEEVPSFEEYNRPLLDAVAAVPPGEKVVLVGHSYGGHSLSLLMQTYPHKVAVAVYVSAFMPVAGSPMSLSLLLEQNVKGMKEMPPDFMLDSTFGIIEKPENNPVETFILGPECLSQRLYQLSPPEDLTLATMLDMYGAVSRVYVVAEEQRLVASWIEVRTIEGADHMPMLSKPMELSQLRSTHQLPALDPRASKTALDLTLAKALVRPGNQFVDDPMMKDDKLPTNGNYGSVKKVYVIAKDDRSCGEELQRRMVALSPGTEVEEIAVADHAVMCSKPRELCDVLVKIGQQV